MKIRMRVRKAQEEEEEEELLSFKPFLTAPKCLTGPLALNTCKENSGS